jgi:hypothetical protein
MYTDETVLVLNNPNNNFEWDNNTEKLVITVVNRDL